MWVKAAMVAIWLSGGLSERLGHEDQLILGDRQFLGAEHFEKSALRADEEGLGSLALLVAASNAVSDRNHPADRNSFCDIAGTERGVDFCLKDCAIHRGGRLIAREHSIAGENPKWRDFSDCVADVYSESAANQRCARLNVGCWRIASVFHRDLKREQNPVPVMLHVASNKEFDFDPWALREKGSVGTVSSGIGRYAGGFVGAAQITDLKEGSTGKNGAEDGQKSREQINRTARKPAPETIWREALVIYFGGVLLTALFFWLADKPRKENDRANNCKIRNGRLPQNRNKPR